ncbi:solute carrier family 35 member F5 isoform X2 [Agrilus planipennis]|uniref:Solute carrier family 35 member F5 isoform X2 n=1 Tax=Agrilus planipennis TaxID=224129 RepID=A0A1W4WSH4_AGRPL|nr:solute carrier family 35 member F5 isoform X2 [Agrilus planipennis]
MDNVCITSFLTKTQRLILGFFILLLVDIICVSLGQLSKYMNNNEAYDKPFFITYIHSCMFSIYLLGFCLWPSWRDYCSSPRNYMIIDNNLEDDNFYHDSHSSLSNPVYVPVKISDRDNIDKSSGTESDDTCTKSVRFNKLAEVRQMSELEAAEAMMARLPYHASAKAEHGKITYNLPIYKVIKLAFVAGLLWFIGNYSHALALKMVPIELVNFLSSTSSIFTLALCDFLPANQTDKFTLSKLMAVFISILGLGFVIFSKSNIESPILTQGALLVFLHALFIASYAVFLRRKIDHEDKIDIPLFFGFIGLINLFVLWPIMLFLNLNDCERIEWPTKHQWSHILLNGFIGTVISEVLWIWGAFLTSPLLAIMMLSLIHPLTMLTDFLYDKLTYPYLFYSGSASMVLAVVSIVVLIQYENWDPVLNALRRAYSSVFTNLTIVRSRISDQNSEQTEALISINSEHEA